MCGVSRGRLTGACKWYHGLLLCSHCVLPYQQYSLHNYWGNHLVNRNKNRRLKESRRALWRGRHQCFDRFIPRYTRDMFDWVRVHCIAWKSSCLKKHYWSMPHMYIIRIIPSICIMIWLMWEDSNFRTVYSKHPTVCTTRNCFAYVYKYDV